MSAGTKLFPVSQDRHGARYWRRFSSYAFVQAHPLVPIVLGEHEHVAACLPILFVQSSVGPRPVALTRLGARTALVAQIGVWRGSYVPSILRVHPFHYKPAEQGQFALLVDEGSGLVTDDPKDEAFFAPDGQLAPALAQVVAFFRNRVQAEAETRAAMDAIARGQLLKPYKPASGGEVDFADVMSIDVEELAELGRGDLSALHRSGALGLVHAALVARHHIGFLANAEAQLDKPPKAAPAPPQDAALSGFFDAIADAQTHDPDVADWLSVQDLPDQGRE